MKNVNVKCNFAQVFAAYENESEVKAVANAIMTQLKKDYAARMKELGVDVTAKEKGVTVTASTSGEKTAAKTTTKATTKTATKTAKTTKAAEKKNTKAETKKTEKKTETKKTKKERKYDVEQIDFTDTKALKKLGLKFTEYSDKCLLLLGNTKPLAKALTGLKDKRMGVFGNSHLSKTDNFEGGFGWLVNRENEHYKEVCKLLKLKAV